MVVVLVVVLVVVCCPSFCFLVVLVVVVVSVVCLVAVASVIHLRYRAGNLVELAKKSLAVDLGDGYTWDSRLRLSAAPLLVLFVLFSSFLPRLLLRAPAAPFLFVSPPGLCD